MKENEREETKNTMQKNVKKNIIWSNFDVEVDNEFFDEVYPDATDYDRYIMACDDNNEYLNEIRSELNIKLSQPIVVIGTLGLWNGKVQGYKEIDSGNIMDCFYDSDCDYMEWFIDSRKNFRAKGAHHDGYNYYLYRVYKDDVSDEQIENFKEKLYYGKATSADISRITRRLGDVIGNVYGFYR